MIHKAAAKAVSSFRRPLLHAPSLLCLLLQLFLLICESRSFRSSAHHPRRRFLADVAAATATLVTTTAKVAPAIAAIDVSGLPVETNPNPPNNGPRGVDPTKLKSGALANTKLGFQVGGGPRPEEVVRAIDEPRYNAVRKSQGLPPMFLDGVPTEAQQPEAISNDLQNNNNKSNIEKPRYLEQEKERFGTIQ